MRKIITFGLVGATACLVLAGCGKNTASTETTSTPNIQTVEAISPTEITTATTTTTTTATTSPLENEELIDTIAATTEGAESRSESNGENGTIGISENENGGINVGHSESSSTSSEASEIKNGDDETIYASVGDYIDLNSVTGGAYSVSGITILSGDALTVMGKSSVMAEKKGTAKIRCTLLDEDTNTQTEGDFTIVIR